MFDADSIILILLGLCGLLGFFGPMYFGWVQKHPDKAPEWAKNLLKK